MPIVSIAAVRNDLVEPSIDGVSLEPGIHLRVGFERELGFPRGGFRLERRIWLKQQSSGWIVIKTLCLPIYDAAVYPANGAAFANEAEESRLRLERNPTGEQLTHLRPRHTDIVARLRTLVVAASGVPMVERAFSGTTLSDTVQVRALDGVLVASANPWMARLLGLSHYDVVPSWIDAEYRVTGRWSIPAPTSYPDRNLDLRLVRRDRMSLDGRITIGAVALSSARTVQYLLPGEEGVLDATVRIGPGAGTPRPPLRIQLPSPVRRLALTITHSGGSIAPAWTARAHNGSGEITPTVVVGTPLAIQAAQPFTIVELYDAAAGNDGARWDISAISYRTELDTVGDIVSNTVRVVPGAVARPRRPFVDSVRALAAGPEVPAAAPLLNASRLETGATPDVRIDDVLRPTRASFGSMSVQNLRGWWTLAESARDEVTGTVGTPPGGTPFQPSLSAGSTAAPEPRALQLPGTGSGVSIPFRADLNNLGQSATISAWVHVTGGGSTAFPCIVGNDYQTGYALCVEATTRRLRFSIAGVSCFSVSVVGLNRWDHVAVVYNGASATFYINGKADAAVAFARGAVPSNTNQPLGVGADPGATGSDPSLLTFQGQLSEVTIHARALLASEVLLLARREPARPVEEFRPAPSFVDRALAYLPLGGDVLDRLSPTPPTAVGTVAWVTPASGSPRTVLSVSGTGFVQLSSRADLQDLGSGLVIQAWLRPDAGLSYPTIVGNNYGASFWLGLDTTNYRPRLWVNGQVHVATTGITAAVWSHVVASYDGVNVRFYVNGADAGVIPAPWGPIAANPSGTLCIGAESGSTAASLQFPYKGQIADVNILRRWPERTPIERPRSLFTEFRLDGSPEDNTAETTGAAIPSAAYVTGTAESRTENSVSFDGARFLAFQSATRPVIADSLCVQAWIRPDPSIVVAQTIVGAGSTSGWWVGLEASTYRLRFERQNVGWNSVASLATGRWNHVSVSYDGRILSLYIDGRLDSEHAVPAAQGGVLPAPFTTVNLGADAGSAAGSLIRAFRGRLAGVRVWSVPSRSVVPRGLPFDPVAIRLVLEDQAVDLSKGVAFAPQGSVAWSPGRIDSDMRTSLDLSGAGYLEAMNRLDLEPGSARGAIEAVIRIDTSAGGTVIDDGGVMRLEIEASTRRPRVVIGGSTFTSPTGLGIGVFHRVLVSFDGTNVRCYVNGALDLTAASAVARPTNAAGKVVVGARTTSTPAAPVGAFKGRLSEVTVYRQAVTPAESASFIAGLPSGAEQITDGVDDRLWLLRSKGVDAFGRPSLWGPARVVSVKDKVAPLPPVSVRVAPVPIEGSVVVEAPGVIRVAVRPPSPLPDLARHIVTVRRDGPGRVLRERFAIVSASVAGPMELRLVLEARAFTTFVVATGDFARVDVDARLRIGLEWPGANRVLCPRAREFRIYRRLGHPDVLRGRITSAPSADPVLPERFTLQTTLTLGPADVTAGASVQVGTRIYRAVSSGVGPNAQITVDYEVRPVLAPSLGDDVIVVRKTAGALASPLGYPGGRVAVATIPAVAVLRSGGIFTVDNIASNTLAYADLKARRPSLPEQGDWIGPLYVLTITGASVPAAFQTAPDPDIFVPGALHALDATASVSAWAIFPTIWHSYDAPSAALKVWFSARGGGPDAAIVTVVAHPRVYLGDRVDVETDVALPTAAERTRVWTIGASAADDRADVPDVLGDPARYGLESAVAGPADVAAIARAAPPRPTAPMVTALSPANFYGRAHASVVWGSVVGAARYWLLRAVDTAIFQRDAEQRRARTGPYAGGTLEDILGSDFAAWAAARFPVFNLADIFAGPLETAAYSAATPVWRVWAERFYGSLDRTGVGPSQLAALADLPGNGVVFLPVMAQPAASTQWKDEVPGFASNRFLYRVSALSDTNAGSLDPSPASEPTPRPLRTPLRAPLIGKTYAGERSVRVDWGLDTNPAVRGYRLFRSENPEELSDVRLRPNDPRLVLDLVDPQLRVIGDAVAVPATDDIQQNIRLYRRDEYEPSPPAGAPIPYDHFGGGTVERTADFVTLRLPPFTGNGARIPLPSGTAIVIAYQDSALRERVLGADRPLPYVDSGFGGAGLDGLTSYHYRVVAYDDLGNSSAGSNVATARAYDYSPAAPAPFTQCERDPADPPGSIRLGWDVPYGSRCIVVRAVGENGEWLPITEWIAAPTAPTGSSGGLASMSHVDLAAPPTQTHSYRIRVQNRSGNINKQYAVGSVPATE